MKSALLRRLLPNLRANLRHGIRVFPTRKTTRDFAITKLVSNLIELIIVCVHDVFQRFSALRNNTLANDPLSGFSRKDAGSEHFFVLVQSKTFIIT